MLWVWVGWLVGWIAAFYVGLDAGVDTVTPVAGEVIPVIGMAWREFFLQSQDEGIRYIASNESWREAAFFGGGLASIGLLLWGTSRIYKAGMIRGGIELTEKPRREIEATLKGWFPWWKRRECDKCGSQLDSEAKYCSECGQQAPR